MYFATDKLDKNLEATRNDEGRIQYIKFEGPDENGYYRMYNLVQRRTSDMAYTIQVGTRGGRVEHPEDIDVYSPVWLYSKALIKGHTKIRGDVVIGVATIADSVITGIGPVRIGLDDDSTPYVFSEDAPSFAGRPTINDSTITADENAKISITNRVRIDRCDITGETYICHKAHLILSQIDASNVSGFAFISKSTLTSSVAAGSSEILGSNLKFCLIHQDAIIRGTKAIEKTFGGSVYYDMGVRYKDSDFGAQYI